MITILKLYFNPCGLAKKFLYQYKNFSTFSQLYLAIPPLDLHLQDVIASTKGVNWNFSSGGEWVKLAQKGAWHSM
jgi:hypothetical protein